MKVFIGIPTGELSRYPEFWHSIQSQQVSQGTQIVFGPPVRGAYIATNQNILARLFLTTDADYFWLLNDDQVYPPHTLTRLLSHNVMVCAPVCLSHDFPFKPLLYDRHDAELGLHPRFLDDRDQGIVQVVATGGGGMLLKREVLEKIVDPWWEVHTATLPDAPPIQSTEDIDFCRKVRALGYPIWCDTDCVVGHQTIFTVWPYRDRDTRGWSTAISRGEDHILVPSATNPSPIVQVRFELAQV